MPRLALRPALLAALTISLTPASLSAQGPPAPTVIVAPVVERQVAATQTFVGTVDPIRRATIGSAVDGRVVEFPVEQGDRVEAGQKLAQLLTDTIGLELAAAQAELDLRHQRLEELKSGSRPGEIEQARARMAAAAARRDYARARRDRAEGVFRNRMISDDERDEAVAAAHEAEQVYLQEKAAHELTVEGPRQEVIAQAEAEAAVQEAVVQRLSDQIKKHTIIARFAGYVVAEHTEEGMWVSRGGAVAEVVALDEVEVVAQVAEQSVPFIEPGASVLVEAPALPGRPFEGRVTRVIPEGDARSRTFPVKIVVKNEIGPNGPILKSGMYARVLLPIGSQVQATLVPKDAVVLGGPAPQVCVVEGAASAGSEGAVRPVAVRLGVASGSLIQVTGDLKPGQMVVVEGNERLRPSQPVRIGRVATPETPAGG